MRSVDLHPYLVTIMAEWFEKHPGGQYSISQSGDALTESQANGPPESNTRWTREVAAYSGVSIPYVICSRVSLRQMVYTQRIIDRYMGHQTQEMRKHSAPIALDILRWAIRRIYFPED